MSLEQQSPEGARSTRRSLMAAGLGAVTAFVANSLARPERALAEGETMKVGGEYTDAHTATVLKNTTNDNDLLRAISTHGGRGVVAQTSFGDAAVEGSNTSGNNIIAGSLASGGVGVLAQSNATYAVQAIGRDDAVGLFAQGENAPALQVIGRAQFTRSGIATIGSGKSKVVVDVGTVTPQSFALATLQQYRSGVRVEAAELSVTNHTVTIRLNTTVSSAIKVGYIVLEG